MYVIIKKEKLPEQFQTRHFEKMPDGRCIVSGREAKLLGTLESATIVFTSNELAKLKARTVLKKGE
ncbi:MAG: hypothetical protein IJQ60_08520 [Prevotella sp.]|nr:hypothetical protein [Prevotella sp.]